MAKNPLANNMVIQLRSGAPQGVAITATDTDILATDLQDARLDAALSGILLATVEACDDANADETYELALIGRQDAAGAYTDLATITVPRGTVGVLAASIPEFRNSLNYRAALAGTTPSITFGLIAMATEVQLLPDFGTVITA